MLIADWKANTYDLELHVKYDSYDEYISKFSNPDDNPKTISNVKVGEKIPVNSLPEKEKWYAYNPDADTNTEKHRLLLGMTFAALTDSKYMAYASPFVLFYLLIILYERYFDKLFVLYPREWLNPSPRWVFGKIGVAVLLTEFSVLMALAFAYAAKRRLERI